MCGKSDRNAVEEANDGSLKFGVSLRANFDCWRMDGEMCAHVHRMDQQIQGKKLASTSFFC